MPSIGDCARRTDITRQTVMKAMRVLRDEGLICWVPGLGYYVKD